jgi:hypothetical protein
MVYLPNEILNIIFSFVPRPQTNKLMKYIIEECYEEDYDPYSNYEDIYDDYRSHYTFKEWYFLYRKWWIVKGNKMYKHTPYPTHVGTDKTLYLL